MLKLSRFILSGALALSFLLGIPVPVHAADIAKYEIGSATEGYEVWGETAPVRAPNGNLWCLYSIYDIVAGEYDLYAAYSDDDGETWTSEVIDVSGLGSSPLAICIDSSGNIHIAYPYWDDPDNIIKYRKRTTSWQAAEDVYSSAYSVEASYLGCDASDNIHLIIRQYDYSDSSHFKLSYYKRTTSWAAEEVIFQGTIDTPSAGDYEECYSPTAYIGSSENVHVSWNYISYDASEDTYPSFNKYRKRTTSWQTTETVSATEYYNKIALLVDSSGNVHFVGIDSETYHVGYHKRTTSWSSEAELANVGEDTYLSVISISIDSGGIIYVVYGDPSDAYKVKMRHYESSSWQAAVTILTPATDHYYWRIDLAGSIYPSVNIPTSGFALIGNYGDFTTYAAEVVYYCPSDDLVWASVEPSITNDPASKAFGVVNASSAYYAKGTSPHDPVVDGDCTYTVTNASLGNAVKINIKGYNFTGGVGWTLNSNVGENKVKITAYYSGQSPGSGVVLTTSDQQFIASLAANTTKPWDFKFETGTFTDGVAKSGVITLTGVAP